MAESTIKFTDAGAAGLTGMSRLIVTAEVKNGEGAGKLLPLAIPGEFGFIPMAIINPTMVVDDSSTGNKVVLSVALTVSGNTPAILASDSVPDGTYQFILIGYLGRRDTGAYPQKR